jgi:hypothetical protein
VHPRICAALPLRFLVFVRRNRALDTRVRIDPGQQESRSVTHLHGTSAAVALEFFGGALRPHDVLLPAASLRRRVVVLGSATSDGFVVVGITSSQKSRQNGFCSVTPVS